MIYKNIVLWIVMLVGYGQNGYSEEVIKIFFKMLKNLIEFDDVILGSVVSVFVDLASLEEGV